MHKKIQSIINQSRNRRKEIAIIAISLVFIAFLYSAVLPWVINLDKHKSELLKLTEGRLKGELILGKIDLDLPLTGGIVLNADKIILTNIKKEPVISGENVRIKFAILPLLFKKIVIKDLKGNNLNATIVRQSEFETNIQEIILPPFPDDIFTLNFENSKSNIKGYKILFKDEYIQPNTEFYLSGNNLDLLNLTENKIIALKANGTLNKKTPFKLFIATNIPAKTEALSNKFRIKGEINNFNIEIIKPYIILKDIKGIIDLQIKAKQNNGLLKTAGILSIKKELIIPDYKLKLKEGSINLNAQLNKDKITIKNILCTVNKLNSKVTGSITKWQSDTPSLNITLSLEDINPINLYESIPSIKETKELLKQIKYFNLNGDTSGLLRLKGALNALQIFGNLKLEKYSINLPNKTIINNITGKFEFQGTQVNIKNWIIPLSGSDLIQINGNFDFAKIQFNDLNLSSTFLDLNKVRKIIISAFKSINIPDTIIKNININGLAHLNITLNGKIEKPLIDGQIKLDINKFNILGFKKPINNITGKILFKKSTAILETFTVYLEKNKPIEISGGFDYYKEEAKNLKIKTTKLNLQQLHNILIATTNLLKIPNSELKQLIISGNTNIDLEAQGPISNIKLFGEALISNTELGFKNIPTSINNINGKILFKEDINIQNLTASLENNKLNISGNSKINGLTELLIDIPDFKLNDLITLAIKLNTFKPSEIEFIKQADLKGSISGKIKIKTDGNNFEPEANLSINKSSLTHPELHDQVSIDHGALNLIKDSINIDNLSITTSGSVFNLSGKLQEIYKKEPSFNFKATSPNITLELLRKISQHKMAPPEMRELIASIENTQGKASLNITANNNGFNIILDLNNISVKAKELQHPIKEINGQILISNEKLSINSIRVAYGESTIKIDGQIKDLMTNPYLNIDILGKVSPIDFKEFFAEDVREKIVFSKHVPFEGQAKGNIHDWDIKFVSSIPKDYKVGVEGLFFKPENVAVIFLIDGRGTTKSVDIDKILLKVGESEFNATGSLAYSDENLLMIDNLHIQIPTINLDELNGFLEKGLLTDDLGGKIKSDLKISGDIFDPDIIGFINLSEVTLPIMKAKDISINVELTGQDANINNAHLNLNGIVFQLSTHINNFKKLPIELTNLNIYSPSLRFTDLLSTFSNKAQKIETVPIIIKNGYLSIDDAIIEKLITSNLQGSISLCSNGLLQINNLKLKTAGGNVNGNLYLNLLKEELGAQLQIIGIKANAAATVLLDLPNEVFGDLNATIVFDSEGTDYEEILANAEAKASLIIVNGRFTRLGTLEHLLTATNIINGGITGLNLNNILGSIIPMHTGSFELLTGDFGVKEGLLETKNLISRGKNLSLEISGDFNITTEDADLDVKGFLSRNVSGLLGPLGKLNIDTLADFIPGLGFIPGLKTKRGLLDIIPGLGFIPGFGGPKRSEKVRKFAVELQGKLYDMSSVKNFRWTR